MKPIAHLCAAALFAASVCEVMGQDQWFVRQSGTTARITSVAFGNGVFLATDGRPLRSSDGGITWTRPQWSGTDHIQTVAFGGGRFVATGTTGGGEGVLISSADGLEYSRKVTGRLWNGGIPITSAFIKGVWVFSGFYDVDDPVMVFADESLNLQIQSAFPSGEKVDWVVRLENEILAQSNGGLYVTTDGLGWSLRGRNSFSKPPLVLPKGRLIEPGYVSNDNAITWDWTGFGAAPPYFDAIAASPSTSVVVYGSKVHTTTDGSNWTTRETGTTDYLQAIAYGNNTFVVVGDSGRITTSTPEPTSLPVAPALQISTTIRLSWPSQNGLYYQREASADLINWEPFGTPIPGNGGIMETYPEITATRKFFRITFR